MGIPLLLLVCDAVPVFILLLTAFHRRRPVVFYLGPAAEVFVKVLYTQVLFFGAVVAAQITVLVAISVFGVTRGTYYQGLIMNAAFATVVTLLAVITPHAPPPPSWASNVAGDIMCMADELCSTIALALRRCARQHYASICCI